MLHFSFSPAGAGVTRVSCFGIPQPPSACAPDSHCGAGSEVGLGGQISQQVNPKNEVSHWPRAYPLSSLKALPRLFNTNEESEATSSGARPWRRDCTGRAGHRSPPTVASDATQSGGIHPRRSPDQPEFCESHQAGSGDARRTQSPPFTNVSEGWMSLCTAPDTVGFTGGDKGAQVSPPTAWHLHLHM